MLINYLFNIRISVTCKGSFIQTLSNLEPIMNFAEFASYCLDVIVVVDRGYIQMLFDRFLKAACCVSQMPPMSPKMSVVTERTEQNIYDMGSS